MFHSCFLSDFYQDTASVMKVRICVACHWVFQTSVGKCIIPVVVCRWGNPDAVYRTLEMTSTAIRIHFSKIQFLQKWNTVSKHWADTSQLSESIPEIVNINNFYDKVNRNKTKWPNVVVEWSTLLLHNRDDPTSSLDPKVGDPDSGISWFSPVSPCECRYDTFKLGHYRFLPHPFHLSFTCHPFLWRYIFCVTEEALLSKVQINKIEMPPITNNKYHTRNKKG
jgi:hypothetical protein